MSDDDLDYDSLTDEIEDRLRDKYPDWVEPHARGSERIISNMIRFELSSAKKKSILLRKNYHRRMEVYAGIYQCLEKAPQSFDDISDVIGGSRGTVSKCLKAMCLAGIVDRNVLTRKYELIPDHSVPPSLIRTPSVAYGKRRLALENGRVKLVERSAVTFFPRKGPIRIDESNPNLEAALAALMNPVYVSFRRPQSFNFEIEINWKVTGHLTINRSGHQKSVEAYKAKVELWENDRRLSKGYGTLQVNM
jgi:hypothetical protein